ncbi:Uncharacterised protein [Mycobacteroides abscessus subsp. abscessus]|nr:Uncharacterised protein [Mycobacteroides abscessus subsp. abscessus]
MECHICQDHWQVGEQRGGIGEQVVEQQLEMLDHLSGHMHPPFRVGRVQISVPMVVIVTVLMVVIVVSVIMIVQDRRRWC